MKMSLFAAAAVLTLAAQPAQAAEYLYELKGHGSDKWTASFTFNTDTAASITLPGSVRYNGVPITFTRPNSAVVETASFSNSGPTFRDLVNQGGLFLGRLPGFPTQLQVFGPQLFTGTTDAPVFLTGTFGLSDISRSRLTDPIQVNYTLTVTDLSAAVPEPATWALMIAGFGAIGFAMRRRNQAVRVTYA